MRVVLFVFFSLLFFQPVRAQEIISVSGFVRSADGNPLANASVLLYYPGSKDSLKTISNDQGSFGFNNVRAANISIVVSYVGFKLFNSDYDYTKKTGAQMIPGIVLIQGDNMLQNLTLESQKVQIKEDTISYKIDSTMYRKNDNVEAVLKQLPGIQVDKDGTVTAQGKQVTRVKVNGKDFFNGDVTTATRELNADMVDRIQIIDDYGDQAAFTGIKDGDPTKTMNIQLKKEKNKGYFGNASAGVGTEGRYLGSLSANRFNNERQISLLANINNTNASTFNFGSGGGAMGNMISSIARGFGVGRGGGGVASALGNFGNNDGISETKSLGLNYRDQWGPRLSVYGSYSFSRRGTNTIQQVNQQNVFNGQTNTNLQNTDQYSATTNHRASYNFEWKIDSMNYVKFTPSFTYRETNSNYIIGFTYLDEAATKLSDGITSDTTVSWAPNLNANLLYNHRFAKRGRTISFNLTGGQSANNSNDNYFNRNDFETPGGIVSRLLKQNIIQDNENYNYGIRVSYTEPLSKKKSIELNYAYNRQFTGNDRETYLVDPSTGVKIYSDSLSTIYDNLYTTHRFGANYRVNEKKYNYTIGLAVQPATIESNTLTGLKQQFSQNIVNYFPVVRFAYNFSKSRSFNFNYNGITSQPSYTQLQPVTDFSNPQYIVQGNPNLRPEFTNTVSLRYNNFNMVSGNVFFGNLSYSFTQDKIVNDVQQLPRAVQKTTYRNSNGFYTLFAFYNISKPIKNRKYVFNIGGNISYNNNISFVTDSANFSERNRGKNWIVGQRVSTDIRLKKWLETTLAVNYTMNNTKYSLLSQNNTNAYGWTLSNSVRIFIKQDFIFSYDIDKTINGGYASSVIANPLIIGATLEKQFLKDKNASLKLQAFDLLNENTGINRSVTGNAITDTRTNRLGRYFLLSFVFRLNKFGSKQSADMQMPGGNMRMPRM